jgi:hypothetical protein
MYKISWYMEFHKPIAYKVGHHAHPLLPAQLCTQLPAPSHHACAYGLKHMHQLEWHAINK